MWRRSAVHCHLQTADSVSTRIQLSVANSVLGDLTFLRLRRPCHPKYLCSESKILHELTFMPDYSKPEKEKSPRPSEDIQVPPIPKQTAGAVTGAAIGSIAGPVGAVVGGVVGALAGKASSSERPVRKAARRGTAGSKSALKRQPVKKSLARPRKGGDRQLRAKGSTTTRSRKSSAAKGQKRTVRQPRKPIRSRQKSTSSRTRRKRSSGRRKRR